MYCPECKSEFMESETHCPDCDVSLVAELPKKEKLENVEWISLHSFPSLIYAEMFQETLENEDISCYIKSDFITSTIGVKGSTMTGSKATLFVPEPDFEKARDLLNQLEQKE